MNCRTASSTMVIQSLKNTFIDIRRPETSGNCKTAGKLYPANNNEKLNQIWMETAGLGNYHNPKIFSKVISQRGGGKMIMELISMVRMIRK